MKFCVVFCRAIENLLLKTSPAVPILFLTRLHKIRVAKGGKNLQRILIQLCNEYGWDCQIKHWQKVLATYAHRSVCFVRFFSRKRRKSANEIKRSKKSGSARLGQLFGLVLLYRLSFGDRWYSFVWNFHPWHSHCRHHLISVRL